VSAQTTPADPILDAARTALRRTFKFPGFRLGQEQAIMAALRGHDTLTVLPTGGGKSLCYQVPALVTDGLTLVVSPLISLMKDQTDALLSRDVPAGLINSTVPEKEQEETLRKAEAGALRMLYLAPERLDSEAFRRRLPRLPVRLLAVDEAHCISQWGHDFRPAYLKLARVHEMVGRVPVMALTATATPRVRDDIVRVLGLQDPVVTLGGFDRPNLFLRHVHVRDRDEREVALVREVSGVQGSVVVYCATVKMVVRAVQLLSDAGVRVLGYHARMKDDQRARVQDAFMRGEVPVVVATNAFGMGVDKPDVRKVVHAQMPGSLEAYYQEAGRAGRDGHPAECVLLADADYDAGVHEFFIDCNYPRPAHVDALLRVARARPALSPASAAPAADLVQDAAGVDEPAFVKGAWNRLREAGVFGAGGQPPALWVRLEASNAEIRARASEHEREVLRRMYRAGGGEALRDPVGVVLPWKAVGGTRAMAALQAAARAGFVSLRDLRGETWLQAKDASAARALPWDQIERGRQAQQELLRAMQAFVREQGCRRQHLLRYFGDPEAGRVECGGCDACGRHTPRRRTPAQPQASTQPRTPEPRSIPDVRPATHGYRVNDWIRHAQFGDGIILAFGGHGGDEAFVKFADGARHVSVRGPAVKRLLVEDADPADASG
jgi:ATP-dependent DNA helicase RecQ